jgi:hypothetical protein
MGDKDQAGKGGGPSVALWAIGIVCKFSIARLFCHIAIQYQYSCTQKNIIFETSIRAIFAHGFFSYECNIRDTHAHTLR